MGNAQTEATESTQNDFTKELSEMVIGDIFSFPNSDTRYVLLDIKVLGENRDNIWAYGSFPEQEFEGLIRDGNCPDHYAEYVEFHGHLDIT